MIDAEGRRQYWSRFYGQLPAERLDLIRRPSSFAAWCARLLGAGHGRRLVDLGAGTGRDSCFWARHGWRVVAVDACSEAAALAAAIAAAEQLPVVTRRGDACEAGDLIAAAHVIYARWLVHAIDQAEQNRLIEALEMARTGAVLAIEARAVLPKDPRGRHVEHVQGGHYRRRLEPFLFKSQLADAGFALLAADVDDNLSPAGGDNPRLLRMVARRL